MSSLEFEVLPNSRVWYFMKFMDSASFQCFTLVSNHVHVRKLACLGWMITLWITYELGNHICGSFFHRVNAVYCWRCQSVAEFARFFKGLLFQPCLWQLSRQPQVSDIIKEKRFKIKNNITTICSKNKSYVFRLYYDVVTWDVDRDVSSAYC